MSSQLTVVLALFNVESVSNKGPVGGKELEETSDGGFDAVSWVEHQFDPSTQMISYWHDNTIKLPS